MGNPARASVLIRPVILSGGSGTRLWPLSRQQYPKQFVPLVSEENLFTATLRRVSNRKHYGAPIIIAGNDHRFFVLAALSALDITDATILLEPQGRNTAAPALAAALAEREAKSPVLHLVLPSDHLIEDGDAFYASIMSAATTALDDNIVLFGITPDKPETAYGYILPGKPLTQGKVCRIAEFHEKPDTDNATALIARGALWNSGMFLYNPHTLLNEAKTLAPEHLALCTNAWQEAKPEAECMLLSSEAYAQMKSHAFDTLFMEHTQIGAVLPCLLGWSDIGSWQALWQVADKDASRNVLKGSVITRDVENSYIRSEGPAVVVLGMKNCTVIATKDAVLVAPSDRAQEIKNMLPLVENSHNEVTISHARVPRPWGTYENIAQGEQFKVKHIVVAPGRSLSLQMHHHRAEHWVVVSGTARVECESVEKLVFPNESVFIPKGASHRLSNPGKIDLQIIEVQSGEYLSEDDIIRFESIRSA